MQIIHWPKGLTILSVFIIWPLLQLAAAGVALLLKDRFYDYRKVFFRCYAWEKNGEIYDTLFKVRRWKRYLPDGGSLIRIGYRKRQLDSLSSANLEKFLVESCRAEVSHWLAIVPFWLFGFLGSEVVLPYMFLYAILINLPCIIAQRYNRPRIVKILNARDIRAITKKPASD